jgi:hypothetical protein
LLMMLELWCREVLDTAGRSASDDARHAPNVLGVGGHDGAVAALTADGAT